MNRKRSKFNKNSIKKNKHYKWNTKQKKRNKGLNNNKNYSFKGQSIVKKSLKNKRIKNKK